jgi:hypothetical protein
MSRLKEEAMKEPTIPAPLSLDDIKRHNPWPKSTRHGTTVYAHEVGHERFHAYGIDVREKQIVFHVLFSAAEREPVLVALARTAPGGLFDLPGDGIDAGGGSGSPVDELAGSHSDLVIKSPNPPGPIGDGSFARLLVKLAERASH